MTESKSRLPSVKPYIVSSPLWSRAPSRDEKGQSYFDFMLLIPGLKKKNDAGIESCMVKIQNCLKPFENVVVYVDLNIKLNLLWVSIKPIPDISKHIIQAIQHEVPEAKVVAGDFNPPNNIENKTNWLVMIGRSVKRTLLLTGKR